MFRPPRSDEKGGHAAVGQLWKHLDIDDGGPGFREALNRHIQRDISAERGRLKTGNSRMHAPSPQLQLSSCDYNRPTECATVKRSLLKPDAAGGPTL